MNILYKSVNKHEKHDQTINKQKHFLNNHDQFMNGHGRNDERT